MYGDEQLRVTGILLHLAAQAADQHVYGAIARAVAPVAGEAQDRSGSALSPGVGDKGHQHFVLCLGQAHRHPVTAELATGDVEAPGAEARTASSATAGSLGWAAARDAPQQVLDPHQQFS